MKTLFRLFYCDLFLTSRFFAALVTVAVFYVLAFFFPVIGFIPRLLFYVFLGLIAVDLFLLFRLRQGIRAQRHTPERLSNGDDNEIRIYLENRYPFTVKIGVIDEVPAQFQRRDIWFDATLPAGEQRIIAYRLRPVKRGEYEFGLIRVYVSSPTALFRRRYTQGTPVALAVYPSFIQMKKYEMLAVSNRLTDYGLKKMRRIGQSMEFEQIKNYVPGDDYRTLNWKATARQGQLMVNSYVDEKSQHIYCIVDKSRLMRMPFDGMSLLDYSINAALALAKVVMLKEDKAGLITISDRKGAVIPADRRPKQLHLIMEALYREKTRYLETNMELLYSTIRQVVKQRSLLLFFTNFESITGMKRQLPLLKRLAKFHRVVVIFFENTELVDIVSEQASDLEHIYLKTVTNKFIHEKRQIVKELNLHGIQSVLTTPESLTVNTINKYLEIKARQLL